MDHLFAPIDVLAKGAKLAIDDDIETGGLAASDEEDLAAGQPALDAAPRERHERRLVEVTEERGCPQTVDRGSFHAAILPRRGANSNDCRAP